jgi:hypothetical protein
MLLRHRPPGIDSRPTNTAQGFEHLDGKWISVLRWLQSNRVEFVLVGAAAEAVRGKQDPARPAGPVAIVPAPYGRNYERLARALWSAHARLRIEPPSATGEDTLPVKMTAEKLGRGLRWTLRCGVHDLDIESRDARASHYQELLYEASRFQLADDLAVEVASPEDIEHYGHLRRTGVAPEIRIMRKERVQHPGPAQAT